MGRGASSSMAGPRSPVRSSAWTGPTRRPSARAASAAVRKAAASTGSGNRDGVTSRVSSNVGPSGVRGAECTTRSAPCSNGRVSTGVATVLSTATRTPAAWPSSQTAARSVMSHIGLAGVSTHSSLVRPGRIAAATASRSVVSVNSTSRPQVSANSASHLRTPQYKTRETST